MADTPDFLDWQSVLRRLAGDMPEVWADPNLEQLEGSIIRDTSKTALGWMTLVWLRSRIALKKRTEQSYEDVLDESEPAPVDVDDAVDRIVEAVEIGKKQAQHQDELPDKGPRVDVPEPPKDVYVPRSPISRQPKPHATAQWIARQSAASKMREWEVGMREDVRWQVVQGIRERISADELAKRLEKRWEVHGVKLQRIAVTEMSMAYNDAVLTLLSDRYVVIPVIGDAAVCGPCHRLLEGKVFWVSPVPIENPTQQEYEQYVWVGKSNIGRSRADWWPCVPLHPNCRHVYVKYRGGDPYEYRVKRR
jgi:hypothetical protein